jgi:uncharacterized lipoprotein YajG
MHRTFLVIALAAMLPACALMTESIDVPYQPDAAQVAPVPGAAAEIVAVDASDARASYRDRVSTKKNGYGMEMAAITASNDIPATVADAIKGQLSARGFKIGGGGADVSVEVLKFYNDFKNGFFSGDAVADVALNVKVLRPDKTIAYAKFYDASGTEPNIQLASGSNARLALIAALRNAINSVVSDPEFIAAVLSVRPPNASAAPSS